ncbi:AmmeMemoRadiSam system protein B [Patescibacteria group bacterium]|nr:AmmeMemoRadiSam system protein B [Patescibacteria group bacterium]MBU1895509.1 AmmeMemoRadiSam system protein B [Patescibacteria group bacterium]
MSLVFSAIVPHPPLLIPNIGKDEIEKIQKTKDSLLQLEQDLYIAKPQLIIIISPHGSVFSDAFSVNAHTNFYSDFAEFGDLNTKREWEGSPILGANISHKANPTDLPVRLISEDKLDHGSTVPLFLLTEHLQNIKILPVGYSNLPKRKHIEFGEFLKDIIMETDKRVAVIASGDLSHALKTDAPGGFHKDSEMFDKTLIELLEANNVPGILQIDEDIVKNSQECAYRSLLIMLGIIKNMKFTFKNYSYEAPFGVGYLVGNFVF